MNAKLISIPRVMSTDKIYIDAESIGIVFPLNNLDYDHIPISIMKDHEVIIHRSKRKVEDICCRMYKLV